MVRFLNRRRFRRDRRCKRGFFNIIVNGVNGRVRCVYIEGGFGRRMEGWFL